MATKYCPKCKKVVIAKVLGRYSRVEINSVAGKKHKVGHLEEDGGCGHMWYTVELPVEVFGD